MVNRFFASACVPWATICGNAWLPGVAGSFDVASPGVVARATCGSFRGAYGVSRDFLSRRLTADHVPQVPAGA